VAKRQGRELVGTVAARRGRIPAFRSDQEERAFWARHSLEEFAKDLVDLDVEIRPARTEQIALRLHKEDLQVLRSLAAKRGVGHTTLARTVLEGWLSRSRSKAKRTDRMKTRRPA
jgi:predicted DNA binding CopG/RHH family protein